VGEKWSQSQAFSSARFPVGRGNPDSFEIVKGSNPMEDHLRRRQPSPATIREECDTSAWRPASATGAANERSSARKALETGRREIARTMTRVE